MDPRSEALAPEHTHQVHSTLVSWRIQTISNDEQKLDANVNNIITVFTLLCMYRSIARTEYLQTANQPLQVSFSLGVDTPKRPLTLR